MDRPVEITRSYSECKFCNDIADMCNEIPDCAHCKIKKRNMDRYNHEPAWHKSGCHSGKWQSGDISTG